MAKQVKYFILIIFLISCGSNQSGSISSQSGEKLSSATRTKQEILSTIDNSRYKKGELLVKFKKGIKTTSSLRTHQSLGVSVSKRFTVIPDLELVSLPVEMAVSNAVEHYLSDPAVVYAEPNYLRNISVIPNDTYFDQQWGLNNIGIFAGGTEGADINAPEAWDISTGSDVIIAIVDTGIDYSHDDLQGNIWANTDENCTDGIDNDLNGYIDDCRGWDFSTCEFFDDSEVCITPKSQDNDPMDDNGHGSHVAGIAGAKGNNSSGISGALWNAQLMPVKFQNADGIGTIADEVEAIQYAIMNGALVINASFGGTTFSNTESDIISVANNAGVLIVASAGNGGEDGIGDDNDLVPHYPSSYSQPNIISVAATDQDDLRGSFTNFGLNSVDVAAPGVFVLSTIVKNSAFALCSGNPFAGLDFCAGTSMSSPHVSALAALLYSYYTHFTDDQIRSTILEFVDKIPSLDGIVATGGRIDAYRSLSSLLNPTDLTATASSATGISLEWADNATGENGYIVERNDGGGFIQIADTGSGFVQTAQTGIESISSFVDTGRAPQTTYSYRVRAYNSIGNSPAYSNVASATTPAEPDPVPDQAQPKSGGSGGCSITGTHSTISQNIGEIIIILLPLLYFAIVRFKRKQKD
jgi:subtilisin family serine protease